MNEITITNYEELKGELRKELYSTAQSVCRIGYLLKIARDTDVLADRYKDVNEFAQKEFNLDKTQVSRFIRINDRFSVDGNSEQLLTEYTEYGSAKLSLMLLLPDEINEELSPEYSKTDIQAIKEEYEEEQKITDLEVMMEDKAGVPDEFIEAVVKQLNDEHPDPIRFFHEAKLRADNLSTASGREITPNKADVKECYTPDGDRTYTIRIPGQGRFMVNMREAEITIVNMRDPGNKSPLSWEEFTEAVLQDESQRTFEEEKKPEEKPKPKKVEKSKPPVAPVQPKPEDPLPEEAAGEEKDPEIEKVEGEIVSEKEITTNDQTIDQSGQQDTQDARQDEVSTGQQEISQSGQQASALQKQIANELQKIAAIVLAMEANKKNWDHVQDQLRDTMRLISSSTF
ncbi:MAG: hypothetical protein J6Y57_01035 [Lachnospiraceae bacterium]|nr:hypothetical protein [Lachnospiraceae bacterium]